MSQNPQNPVLSIFPIYQLERFFLTDHHIMLRVRNGARKKHMISQPEMVVEGREIVRLKALMFL